MNVPMSWIKEYVELSCDTSTFMDKMTDSGSKVEALHVLGGDITKVCVGKILSIEKHPDADKLVITKINIGDKILQIVTGATNVFVGAYVPVALDGATLANGVKIKNGKLRGQASEGMLCSIEELGYSATDYPEAPEDGIYIFKEEIVNQGPYKLNDQLLGQDVVPLLQLYEEVVEYEITSNRPDCFSVIGLAREAAATFRTKLKYPSCKTFEVSPENPYKLKVEIKNESLAPRYIARVVEDVKIEPSPQWLRHRLTAAGIRPVNNIVDITNYVCLELGQPMHAFSIENIDNQGDEKTIVVRNAYENEPFVTLDGAERTLDSSMLVIADCNKALAIAGVMGGENSKIREDSTTILFESANFNGTNIRLTSKKLGLRTESSAKFEKGIDPNLALQAIERAATLVEELNCGRITKTLVDNYPLKREERQLTYSPERINRLLGTNISEEDCANYLELLELKVSNNVATIPTFRPDLEAEADLAEEIGRMYGYNNIQSTLAAGTPTVGRKSTVQKLEELVKNTMTAQGFCEILTYAFESPKVFDKLNLPVDSPVRKAIKLSNPLGDDYSLMRTSTLNGMLTSLSTNFNRRNEDVSLFEVSRIYTAKSLPLTELPEEPRILTLGLYGTKGNQEKDFYDVKGCLEELFDALMVKAIFKPLSDNSLPFMHPGRTAEIFVENSALNTGKGSTSRSGSTSATGSTLISASTSESDRGQAIGYVGELHPSVCSKYEIETRVLIAVVNLDLLFAQVKLSKTYEPLPKYPGVQRDIALLVKEETFATDIEKAIRSKAKLLSGCKLFDVYRGKQIEDKHKSMAYSLSFRASDRTLTEEEVNKEMDKILKSLEEMGASVRKV